MATLREIKRRIKTSKNISQVTRAMQMVSAVKMRRAQEAALAGRSYIAELEKMVGILASQTDLEEKSVLLTMPPKINRVMMLVVAPRKGLCGPLVTNLYRQIAGFMDKSKHADQAMKTLQNYDVEMAHPNINSEELDISFVTLEKKSKDIVKIFSRPLLADFNLPGKQPKMEVVQPISEFLVDQFVTKQTDMVLIAYTHFVNTVSQKAVVKQFLPVVPSKVDSKSANSGSTIIFEPSPKEVLDGLLSRFAEAMLYQIVLEATASEHSARMVAMKNAHDNAKDIISDLTLFYNKARQNAITNELADAVSSRLGQS